MLQRPWASSFSDVNTTGAAAVPSATSVPSTPNQPFFTTVPGARRSVAPGAIDSEPETT